MERKLQNITIYDNGAGFCVMVDGLIINCCRSLGDAWRHIQWMYEVASQIFTVGKHHIHIKTWLQNMKAAGILD